MSGCPTTSWPADAAALDGRHVATHVRAHLDGRPALSGGIRLLAEAPLRWVSPAILRPGIAAPARGRLLAWTDALVRFPTVSVRQDGAILARRRLPWASSPGRIFRIPAGLVAGADPGGGTVTLSVH